MRKPRNHIDLELENGNLTRLISTFRISAKYSLVVKAFHNHTRGVTVTNHHRKDKKLRKSPTTQVESRGAYFFVCARIVDFPCEMTGNVETTKEVHTLKVS